MRCLRVAQLPQLDYLDFRRFFYCTRVQLCQYALDQCPQVSLAVARITRASRAMVMVGVEHALAHVGR